MNETEKRNFLIDLVRPNSGCDLVESCGFVTFREIFEKSNGDPCDECADNNSCTFKARQKEQQKLKRIANFGKVPFKTNAKIAEEKGISKRQVSKMRRRGLL